MLPEAKIPLLDLVLSLSDTIDLVSPQLANHHLEVAYIARELAKEYGLPAKQQNELLTAGAVHDVGALSLSEKLETLEFEIKNPSRHAELGYLLLETFSPFSELAPIVRFHHVPWNGGDGSGFNGERVPVGSHILHLADRISALRNRSEYILNQADNILERITAESGKMFMPDLVDAFARVSEKQCFWLNITSPHIELPISQNGEMPSMSLNMEELLSLSKLFARIIDFRSRYTATHSAGVGAVSKALARLAGFSETECGMMEISGYLHDLGKLAIPAEILEKPGKLTKDEFNVIFSHPLFTYRSLQRIRDLSTINMWASFHHERLNGCGYPYHHRAAELQPGARIMAVADIFTAILEERPYHKNTTVKAAMTIIQKLSDNSELDPGIAALLKRNLDKINSVRVAAQTAAIKEYRDFYLNGDMGPAEKCPGNLPEYAGYCPA